jgi:hypothetical protein
MLADLCICHEHTLGGLPVITANYEFAKRVRYSYAAILFGWHSDALTALIVAIGQI